MKTSGRKLTFLILFLLAGGAIFWGRHDLVWGLKGYLLDEIDYLRIQSETDLPPVSRARTRPAEISGIPDYKHAFRVPYKGKILTCYRMVGFENRLCVCTEQGLAEPKAIDEILRERTLKGRLEVLGKSPMAESLRRLFLKTGGIRVAEDAYLLTEDRSPLPSKEKLGFLAFCVVVCCLSAYRLIK